MKIILSIVTILIFSISSQLMAESYCGTLENYVGQAGPFDYYDYDSRKEYLPVVERHHFSKKVERLEEGLTATVGSDISFVLRVFPNHPRALDAMSRLAIRDKTTQPAGSSHTTLCFFERAIRFKPNDAVARSLFASHLLKIGKPDLAIEQLVIATELEPENPTSNYNLGLLYFDKKNYVQAKKYAKKAYSQNFPLPGLKNKLKSVGKW